VDEDKIIEIRKTVREGMRGITEGDRQDYIVWTQGQGEGSDGGEGEDTKTRGAYRALLCLESHTRKNNEMRKGKPSG